MSYNVYITRAEFWAENEGTEIPADEWQELVGADPELAIDEKGGPGFAVLMTAGDDQPAWLDWTEGNIYASYPGSALQRKMLQIAARLGARLQGDDGEIYTSISDFPAAVGPSAQATEANVKMSPYRRRQIIRAVITYGTVAAVIVAANVFDLW